MGFQMTKIAPLQMNIKHHSIQSNEAFAMSVSFQKNPFNFIIPLLNGALPFSSSIVKSFTFLAYAKTTRKTSREQKLKQNIMIILRDVEQE